MDYLCDCKSEIGNVCNPVEDHCLGAMKIVHHHANGRFDWLISGHQSIIASREVISILSSGNTKDLRLSIRWLSPTFMFFETIRCKVCICLYHKQFTGI